MKPQAIAKKPKRIVRQGRIPNQVVIQPHNPLNRYVVRSLVPAPGGIGRLSLTIQS